MAGYLLQWGTNLLKGPFRQTVSLDQAQLDFRTIAAEDVLGF